MGKTETFDELWSSNDFKILTQLINSNKNINLLLILSMSFQVFIMHSYVIAFGYNWQQWRLVLAICSLQTFLVVSFDLRPKINKVYKALSGSSCCLTYVYSKISVNFCPFFLEEPGSVLPQAFHMQVPPPETLFSFFPASFLLSQTNQCMSGGHWKYLWVFKSPLWKSLNCLFLLMII